jgi:hypothetical protein
MLKYNISDVENLKQKKVFGKCLVRVSDRMSVSTCAVLQVFTKFLDDTGLPL